MLHPGQLHLLLSILVQYTSDLNIPVASRDATGLGPERAHALSLTMASHLDANKSTSQDMSYTWLTMHVDCSK